MRFHNGGAVFPAGVGYKDMTKCVEASPFDKMRGYDFRIFPHLTPGMLKTLD